jgi:hypothetical protein
MDKLNLMKALLTLYLSAVAAVFFFKPTIKERLPGQIQNNQACMLSKSLRHEKIMNQFFLVGNAHFKLVPGQSNCLAFKDRKPESNIIDGDILLVREGHSLWGTITTKLKKR